MVQMAFVDRDREAASALHRSLEEMTDEGDLLRQSAAERSDHLKPVVEPVSLNVWPAGR